MAGDRIDITEGDEVVRRTIVGGRPRSRKKVKIRIPIGMEKVLCRAAMDGPFEARLFEDRAAALDEVGYPLLDSERATLMGVPQTALEALIASIDVPKHGRRKFMQAVAASVAASMVAGVGCDSNDGGSDVASGKDGGSLDDSSYPPDTVPVDTPGADFSLGIQPDTVDVEPSYDTAGILPDSYPPDTYPSDIIDVSPPMDVAGIMPDTVDVEPELAPIGILPDTVPPDVIDVMPEAAPTGILPDWYDE